MIPNEFKELLTPPDQFDARPAVAFLLNWAHGLQASDLHLSPLPESVEVSVRCDGVLRHQFDLEPETYQRLLVGLKNLAKLVSYKRSTPQDGALQMEGLEARVATVPTVHGQRAIVRLLTRRAAPGRLQSLGFDPKEMEVIESLADQPQGLILATGPAGSGKTTTLLSLMTHLVERRKKRLASDEAYRCSVATLEDPVEYVVPAFQQTSIQAERGMTFPEGLRSILRQDPELILVGEIRDPETAKAVVQAGLSGHLVFSTLHARDSVGVVPRMLELGVASYQLGAALAGILSQRLLRALCPNCKRRADEHWVPVGCQECANSGYKGRLAVPEIVSVDEAFRELVLERAPLSRLRECAQNGGTVSLWDSAMKRAREGLTSLAEIERVIPRS